MFITAICHHGPVTSLTFNAFRRARFLGVRVNVFSPSNHYATSLASSDNLSVMTVFITALCHHGLATSLTVNGLRRARFLEVRTKIFSYFVGRATSLTSSDNLSATIVFIITDICHHGLVTSQSQWIASHSVLRVRVNVFSPSNHYATPLAFD